MNLRITPYKSPDYEATVLLRFDILRKPLGLTFSASALAKEISDYHLSLWEGDELLACLVMTPISTKEVKMRQFAVREDMQRQGIGKTLLKEAEQWAVLEGYENIVLNAREIAIAFYLKNKYQTEGDWFEEVSIPHKKMRKKLYKGDYLGS